MFFRKPAAAAPNISKDTGGESGNNLGFMCTDIALEHFLINLGYIRGRLFASFLCLLLSKADKKRRMV
ncbi:hypothetical protein GWI33_021914 [Rhynchophorus ferrugineus]|uniref:Uncharacterized protein n=1 Tax=Rhynchophorus ferrugineus TaxID=354439 RepID=A0A834I0N3_RHYFE|nr:hypothetical protein GWI33_021914 [Rhynchophorus ferrugineus]